MAGGGGNVLVQRVKFWGPMVIGVLGATYVIGSNIMQSAEQKKTAFTGTVLDVEEVRGRRKYHAYVHIATDSEQMVRFKISDSKMEYFQYGDRVVKLAGEDDLAVFREGRQLKGYGVYLDRDLDPSMAAAPPEDASADAVAEPAPEAAVPAPDPAAAMAASPEAQVDQLVAQASAHWRSGNRAGSLDCANKALALWNQHLGPQHPKTATVQRMIAAANQPAR